MLRLGLSSMPKYTPKVSRPRRRATSRASLQRAASSDTDYVDGDAIVPDCDVWLDNSGSQGALDGVVEQLWEQRLAPFARNLEGGTAAEPHAAAAVAANPDGPEGAARRLAARLRLAGGQDVAAVESGAVGDRVTATLRPARTADRPALGSRMTGAGLVAAGEGVFRSADPGLDAEVRIVEGPV